MMPVVFNRRIALCGLHFITACAGQFGDMDVKAAAFGPMRDPEVSGRRQSVAAPAAHDIFAQVVAGGGENMGIALRDQFQIRNEALEEFGQRLPGAVAQGLR